jgi:hypothetical protein
MIVNMILRTKRVRAYQKRKDRKTGRKGGIDGLGRMGKKYKANEMKE